MNESCQLKWDLEFALKSKAIFSFTIQTIIAGRHTLDNILRTA